MDRVRSYFSAETALQIAKDRAVVDRIRGYDISNNDAWGWRDRYSDTSNDTSQAFNSSITVGRDLAQNKPLGKRIKRLYANNVIGSGIQVTLTTKNGFNTKPAEEIFEEWFDSTDCDFQGRTNGYGLQWLWAATVAESGGVLIRRVIDKSKKFPLQFQTFDQSSLYNTGRMELKGGGYLLDGMRFSKLGKLVAFRIKKNTMFGYNGDPWVEYSTSEVEYIYDWDSPDKHAGITVMHAVAKTLQEREDLKYSKLEQQKIASCFALFITNAETPVGEEIVDADGQRKTEIGRGTIHYESGEDVSVNSVAPPKADNSTEMERRIDRDIAAGSMFTYEQVTGDMSQVNHSSARVARSEMYLDVDHLQQHVFKPRIMNMLRIWWLDIYRLKFGPFTCGFQLTMPVRASVNPMEELEVTIRKVRAGFLTPDEGARIYGKNFYKVLDKWAEVEKEINDKELSFDIQPSKFAFTGNQLNDDDAASSNRENALNKKTSESDEKSDREFNQLMYSMVECLKS